MLSFFIQNKEITMVFRNKIISEKVTRSNNLCFLLSFILLPFWLKVHQSKVSSLANSSLLTYALFTYNANETKLFRGSFSKNTLKKITFFFNLFLKNFEMNYIEGIIFIRCTSKIILLIFLIFANVSKRNISQYLSFVNLIKNHVITISSSKRKKDLLDLF